MLGLTQRLPLEQGLYNTDIYGKAITVEQILNYPDTWGVESGSISYSMSGFFINNVYVMAITPTSSADVTLTLDVTTSFSYNDLGALFVSHGQFKCESPNYTTVMRLSNSTDDSLDSENRYSYSTTNEGNEQQHVGGLWSTGRSNVMVAPKDSDEATFNLTIVIKNHETNTIYFTSPAIVPDNFWLESAALINMKRYMPDFYWDKDSAETSPQKPFFRFIDIATFQINSVLNLYSDWYQLEEFEYNYDEFSTDDFTKSKLLHPDVALPEYDQWLFQFIGSQLIDDISISNTSYIPNKSIFRKWQLNHSYFGRAAGTTQAIKESVKQVLTGDKTVSVTPGGAGDPWVINIVTLTSETPSSSAVIRAAELARPLGYAIDHQTVSEINLTLGNFPEGILGTAELG